VLYRVEINSYAGFFKSTMVVDQFKKRTIGEIFHNQYTAWMVLGVSLVLTIFAWVLSNAYVESRAQDRFNFEVDNTITAITGRMDAYEQVLRGGIGLFKASDEVTRSDWKAYVSTLLIDTYWPGIQGVGYAEMITPEDRLAHENRLHDEGFPNYGISPGGERDIYSAIIYLEPFSGRNLRAFGYDMYSNPVRREAMRRAADQGKPALSGKVTLVQETNKDIQAGFLVYLPLYRSHMSLISVEERRVALRGYVYSAFRVKDLLQGTLTEGASLIKYKIYDGDVVAPEQLLYDSLSDVGESQLPGKFREERSLHLQGRNWTIQLSSRLDFDRQLDNAQPTIVAVGGLTVDVLLFIVIMSIARHRKSTSQQALALATTLGKLKSSEQKLKRTHAVARIGSWTLDPATNDLQWSEETYRIFGLAPGAPMDFERFMSFIHVDDRERLNDTWKAALNGARYDIEHRIQVGNEIRWVNERAELSFDSEHKVTLAEGSVQDITERKRAEEALHLTNRVLYHAREGIMIVDADVHFVDVNPMFTEITGYSKDDVLGRSPRMLSSGKHDKSFYQEMWTSLAKTGNWHGEVWNRNKSGELYVEQINISEIRDPDTDQVSNYVGLFSDVTEIHKHRERMEHMAHHDVLTGLPNRLMIMDRMKIAVARSNRHSTKGALLFIDLDGFKLVNDNYGHAVGDRILIEVGQRLSDNLRTEDTVARLGGDEFAILMTDLKSVDEIKPFARRIISSLAEDYIVDSRTIGISASIGIALLPHHANTVDKLMIKADEAMYKAKKAGKNGWYILPLKPDVRPVK
jgi:diguanylate cyclase (GGDEF)-like protein/PAS domain S-box-containing protein